MLDRLLIFHWNEISFPELVTPEEMHSSSHWASAAQMALSEFLDALKVRPDLRISFSRGVFHGQVAGKPFLTWLELWLGREGLRKIKARAIQPHGDELRPIAHLDCELTVKGRGGEGLTRAHLADTWAWSFSVEGNECHTETIRADKTSIDQAQVVSVDVRNLACRPHGEVWKEMLAAWGQTPSENHILLEVDGYQYIMYPLDHGYPHLHVKLISDPTLNAKYRIDKFSPLTKLNPAGLDRKMETWIEDHREQLLVSWDRCQAGKYPLKF